ncbi:MAG TPA: nuclear transport factor 2 family protein [Caulobacteraceae bacterium]
MKSTAALVSLTALLAASLGACTPPASSTTPAIDTGKISAAVKADADQAIADYNAHDADKTESHVAAGAVMMFHGQPNGAGGAAGVAGLKQVLAASPDVHVTLADETVDVAASGDMAVFRSSYVVTLTDPKTKKPTTESGNYLIGYKPQPDGSWKQVWSVVSNTTPMAAPAPAMPAAKS